MKPDSIVPARTARKASGAPKARRKAGKPAIEAPASPAVRKKDGRGRPSSYRPEYCAAMLAFFQIEVERVERTEVPDGHGGVSVTEQIRLNTFPTITRFAHTIDSSVATIRRWATALEKDGSLKYPDFADAYLKAREAQESLLVEGGMSGLYNSRFCLMAAKNLLGWRSAPDRTDHQAINSAAASESMRALDALYVDLFQQHEAQRQERGAA